MITRGKILGVRNIRTNDLKARIVANDNVQIDVKSNHAADEITIDSGTRFWARTFSGKASGLPSQTTNKSRITASETIKPYRVNRRWLFSIRMRSSESHSWTSSSS
jgi:hypothetical protein